MRSLEKRARTEGKTAGFTLRELVERPMGTIAGSGMIISDSSRVPDFSGLLSDYSARVRSRAAWSIGYAAAKGVDISEAKEALDAGLRDEERDVAIACAYALTLHHLNKSPDSRPPLSCHHREAVRVGANIAISDTGRTF